LYAKARKKTRSPFEILVGKLAEELLNIPPCQIVKTINPTIKKNTLLGFYMNVSA